MLKISHPNTFYFLSYTHVRYVKCLFTNIQKQQSIVEISLLFKKFTNFTVNDSRILRFRIQKFQGIVFI